MTKRTPKKPRKPEKAFARFVSPPDELQGWLDAAAASSKKPGKAKPTRGNLPPADE